MPGAFQVEVSERPQRKNAGVDDPLVVDDLREHLVALLDSQLLVSMAETATLLLSVVEDGPHDGSAGPPLIEADSVAPFAD